MEHVGHKVGGNEVLARSILRTRFLNRGRGAQSEQWAVGGGVVVLRRRGWSCLE